MFNVEIVSRLQPSVVRGVDRVLVTSLDGTPLAVVAPGGGGGVLVAHAVDRGFPAVLAGLGIDRTLVVDRFKPSPTSQLLLPG